MTQVLNPLTFPLQGMRMIEASAGTGKTYTIAALYLRLVLGHGEAHSFKRPLSPPEILVVTFTNAATEELRDRIRQRLTEAAAFFRGLLPGDEYLQRLGESFPENSWFGQAQILDHAAQWMDESAIYTIHGWCKRMLREHAFDSGSLFDLELDTNDQELLEEAACDYWRNTFYGRPAELVWEALALIKCQTPQDLLKKVKPWLDVQKNMGEDPFALLTLRVNAIEDARRKWAADFDQAVEKIRTALAAKSLRGNYYRKDYAEKWLQQMAVWVQQAGPLPDDKILAKFSQTGLQAGAAKNKIAPRHVAYEALDRLRHTLSSLDIENAFLLQAAVDIGRRFRKEKQRLARMDFNDLLIRLEASLKNPKNKRLPHIIRQQYPVALIDEFQDTDPIQFSIFSRIYLDQPETGLFLIGDPKQAIYSFRNADLHVYLKARRQTQEDHRYTLKKNYRSTEGMVQAINRLFLAAAEYPDGAFLFKEQIPYTAVECQGRAATLMLEGQVVKSLTIWQLIQDKPLLKGGDEGYENRMAEATAGEIVRILNLARQRPPKAGFKEGGKDLRALCPADIAVLVRSGREAVIIRQAMARRGLRSVYLSDRDTVFETEEAQSVLYLLCACSEPEKERAVKTALATKVLELPLRRLDQFNQDEIVWEEEIVRFRGYRSIWQSRGVLPMLRKLFHDFEVPRRLLSTPGGERVLTNLLHLAELLQTEAYQLDGEKALIRWFAEQLENPNGDTDSQILRLESDQQLVRVVTIHKSKGLEYPLAFLPFICSFQKVATKGIVKYHDAQGELRIVNNPEPNEVILADQERLAEDLRLLYVALTRSQYACWLGLGVVGQTTKKSEKSQLHQSGIGYLLSGHEEIAANQLRQYLLRLKGDCEHIHIEWLPDDAPLTRYEDGADVREIAPPLQFTATIPRYWQISSYSGIIHGASLLDADGEDAAAAESPLADQLQELQSLAQTTPSDQADAAVSIHSFPRGPDPGTFLHNLFEWSAKEGFPKIAHDPTLIHDKISLICQRRGWERWSEMLIEWFVNMLETPLRLGRTSPELRFADLMPEHCQPEMAFLFSARRVRTTTLDDRVTRSILEGYGRPKLRSDELNGMLKGFIDLALWHQDRYYVLDYKSNYLGENEAAYGHEALARAMLEHRYDLQYVLYTLALHRLLKIRWADYDYGKHMGGAIYVFLRGVDSPNQGLYVDRPPQALIEELDAYFSGKELAHATR